jgi:hypothetical protein
VVLIKKDLIVLISNNAKGKGDLIRRALQKSKTNEKRVSTYHW